MAIYFESVGRSAGTKKSRYSTLIERKKFILKGVLLTKNNHKNAMENVTTELLFQDSSDKLLLNTAEIAPQSLILYSQVPNNRFFSLGKSNRM